MSSAAPATFSPTPLHRRPALRPLALPTEHGGWGFLFEPLVLAMIVAPSWGGALVAVAFIGGFLTRQPLKLALQDLLRGRSYPRTSWCWTFAASYAAIGLLALSGAIALSGWTLFIPLGLVAPLGLTQIFYDANNRSRALVPERGGTLAMASSAAAIGIAGGLRIVPALALSAVLVARSIPAIFHVRTLIQRSHGQPAGPWLSLASHAVAVALVAMFAPPLAVVAMLLLFIRAAIGVSRPIPRAKTIGWTEVTWGVVSVALFAAAWLR